MERKELIEIKAHIRGLQGSLLKKHGAEVDQKFICDFLGFRSDYLSPTYYDRSGKEKYQRLLSEIRYVNKCELYEFYIQRKKVG